METTVIATKFVRHDVPELKSLQNAKVYLLREKLNKGEKMNRAEKNWQKLFYKSDMELLNLFFSAGKER